MFRPRMPLVAAALMALAPLLSSQTATHRAIGEVKNYDPVSRTLILATDGGRTLTVTAGPDARCLTVSPGETDLKNATGCSLTQIEAGDRILASGESSDEPPGFVAILLVVMKKAELEEEYARKIEEWRERGITGRIVALDAEGREIRLAVSSLQGNRTILVEAPEAATILRYAPDSTRYRDARSSLFAELRPGDQLRVLGEETAGGERVVARELVAGAFRTVVASIAAIDTSSGTIQATDLERGAAITFQVGAETVIRRLPERMAQMLARRMNPATGAGAGAAGGPPGMGFQQLLERAPEIALEELKPQETIVVSCSAENGGVAAGAITIAAGVEPLTRAAMQGSGPLAGRWNLEIDIMQ